MRRRSSKKIDTGEVAPVVRHVPDTDVISKGRPSHMRDGRKEIAKTLDLTAANGREVTAELRHKRMEELELDVNDGIFCPDIVADKVLVACTIIFTREKNFDNDVAPTNIPDFLTIHASIGELADLMDYPRTVSGYQHAREDIMRAADALYAWDFSCRYRGRSRTFHVFGGRATTDNGVLRATFTANYYKLLAGEEGTYTRYHLDLFKLTGAPYRIGRQVALHVYRTTRYQVRDINGTPYHVVNLKVANLLKYGNFPDYNAAMARAGKMDKDDNSPAARAARDRGHWRARTRYPLEKAMDKLEEAGLLANWEYSHGTRFGKPVPVSPEELEELNDGRMDFDTYSKLHIDFYWGAPVDMARVEADRNARLKKKAARESRKNAPKKIVQNV